MPAKPKLEDQKPAEPVPEPISALIVEDEESMRHFLEKGLVRLGFRVRTAGDGETGVRRWTEERFDVLVLDLRLPDIDGIEVLERVRAADPLATVVLMTAYGSVSRAVEAMQLGASDFLQKPFELDELAMRIERALSNRRTREENMQLRELLRAGQGFNGLVGRSQAMQGLAREIDLLRDSSATVLLAGESGTGKGLVARAIHSVSRRSEHPFVVLHCPAVPDTLVESTLFGHEPGSFTGATSRKTGLLARAHRGTLFLDEIADMSLAAQAKIERFLQDREFVPVGGTRPLKVDVRVVAATNKDLAALAREGAFREELLWRLDVVRLRVPPLRDRRDDIPLLVRHVLQRVSRGTAPKSIASDAMGALCAYEWPGNVRELENVVERMAVMAGSRKVLGVHDLPEEIRGAAAAAIEGGDYEGARARFEEAYFTALLERCQGNVTEAARVAGLSRGHLHRKLKSLRGPGETPGADR
ncbi:MAG: sigma-54 dependent transcriptional regulator [Planctomycetota bacterium]